MKSDSVVGSPCCSLIAVASYLAIGVDYNNEVSFTGCPILGVRGATFELLEICVCDLKKILLPTANKLNGFLTDRTAITQFTPDVEFGAEKPPQYKPRLGLYLSYRLPDSRSNPTIQVVFIL